MITTGRLTFHVAILQRLCFLDRSVETLEHAGFPVRPKTRGGGGKWRTCLGERFSPFCCFVFQAPILGPRELVAVHARMLTRPLPTFHHCTGLCRAHQEAVTTRVEGQSVPILTWVFKHSDTEEYLVNWAHHSLFGWAPMERPARPEHLTDAVWAELMA